MPELTSLDSVTFGDVKREYADRKLLAELSGIRWETKGAHGWESSVRPGRGESVNSCSCKGIGVCVEFTYRGDLFQDDQYPTTYLGKGKSLHCQACSQLHP